MDGEYDVYNPELTDDMVDSKEVGDLWVAHIDVNPNDIEAIKSYGTVMYTHFNGPQVNCTFVCINVTFPYLDRCLPGLLVQSVHYWDGLGGWPR